MAREELTTTTFPVDPLEDLQLKTGSGEGMAQAAISQLISSLREVGVTTESIEYYFTDELNKVNLKER